MFARCQGDGVFMTVLVYCKKAAFLCGPLVEEYAVDVGVFEFVGPFGVMGIAYYGSGSWVLPITDVMTSMMIFCVMDNAAGRGCAPQRWSVVS